jgi:hypothetical protein
MSIVWPALLPQSPLVSGYNEKLPNTIIRTQMDNGVAKTRRRFTATVRPMSISFTMTPSQVALLDTFYNDTTKGGSLRFEWTHPRTGVTKEFRFVNPPEINGARGNNYSVSISLEQMP